ISVASTLERFGGGSHVEQEEFVESKGVWFHYGMHGSLSDVSPQEAAAKVNRAVEQGCNALDRADWVILTLGSAWVYRLCESGEVVVNCHKQPARLFDRELLSVDEVTATLRALLSGVLRGKRVILTVSPIRHLADGLEQNSLSKAILRVAIDGVVREFDGVYYFPSYEILMDDLRDYRFYAEDMLHPSGVAADYIWQHFSAALFSDSTQRQYDTIDRVVKATQHRPMRRYSQEHVAFCRANLKLINQIKGVDLSSERGYFEGELAEIDKK
ncbi:MAG: GSCFA domain-containing protein, partial [Rikenellaceae bacterium]